MDLLTSIKRAQSTPLLQDIKVYSTPNVQPTPSSLKEIVEAAGGQVRDEIIAETRNLIEACSRRTFLWFHATKYSPFLSKCFSWINDTFLCSQKLATQFNST